VDKGQKGVLVSSETPGETFDYLVRELERTKSSFQFDLKNKGRAQKPKLVENQYEFVGDGTFMEAYKLLWFLEKSLQIQ